MVASPGCAPARAPPDRARRCARSGLAGGPQANLSHLLKGCDIEGLSQAQARAVGALAARAGHDDIVEVSVVEGAVRRNHAVVTSNAGHIRKVASVAGADITVHNV